MTQPLPSELKRVVNKTAHALALEHEEKMRGELRAIVVSLLKAGTPYAEIESVLRMRLPARATPE